MAGETQDSNWPLPKFYFKIDLGSVKDVLFQEVSGLEAEAQPIEYRGVNSPVFSTIKMPGIAKIGNVTMKKGIFKSDNAFWEWYGEIKMNTIARQNVVIKLCDEGGNPTIVWTLANAWPTKISSTDINADAGEVAVETIEFSHEGLTISNQ
ncbi:phage tail protein [Mariniradius saccharolyticus]|nr:phage tail protein [Mariniradius saccharolyticus]